MKTTIFKSTIVIAAVLALFSCQKQDWTYKGPQYFEFSAFENGQTANNGVYTKENGDIITPGSTSISTATLAPGSVTVRMVLFQPILLTKAFSRQTRF